MQGLRPFQVPHCAALIEALDRSGAVLDGSDTGTGKTFVAVAIARHYGVTPLVVAPKPTLPSWERAGELLSWPVEAVNYERLRGRATKGKLASSDWGRAIPMGSGSRWLWNDGYEFIIFDEVDRCGGATTLNSKLLIGAKRQAARVLCLSATAADDPLELKALGFALGLHNLNDFWKWILKHGCKPSHFGGFEFTKNPEKAKAAMLKLHQQIFPARGSRLCKKDIPGFPVTQIETKLLPADATKVDRLAQEIAEAYRNRRAQEDNGETGLEKSLRARQALELLMVPETVDLAVSYAKTSKVVLFCNFRETVAALRQLLRCPGIVWGEQDPDERQDVIDRFQADNLDFLISTYGAGGVGAGFHGRADRTTLKMPCYSAKMLIQAFGRVNREGGGFSQQFLLYADAPAHRQIAKTVDMRLANIETLNDGILNGRLDTDTKLR